MYNDIECGNFNVPNPEEIMLETRELIKNINVTNSIFRSNHASNYIALGGTLSKDRDKIIKLIDDALSGKYGYKPENLRRL